MSISDVDSRVSSGELNHDIIGERIEEAERERYNDLLRERLPNPFY